MGLIYSSDAFLFEMIANRNLKCTPQFVAFITNEISGNKRTY